MITNKLSGSILLCKGHAMNGKSVGEDVLARHENFSKR